MKTYLTYGVVMALCGAILGMIMFVFGFHSDPGKMQHTRWISTVIGIVIAVVCMWLAVREKRSLTPPDLPWGYGSAMGAALMTGIIGAVLIAVFNYVYFAYINPHIRDVIMQMQLDQMTARGLSADQMDQYQNIAKKWLTPVALTISGLISTLIGYTIISLIMAIFMKNRAESGLTPPPVAPAA